MEKLMFYSLSKPEKLDRIGEYLFQTASRDISRLILIIFIAFIVSFIRNILIDYYNIQTSKWICYYCYGSYGSTISCMPCSNFKFICRKFFKDGSKVTGIYRSSVTNISYSVSKSFLLWDFLFILIISYINIF